MPFLGQSIVMSGGRDAGTTGAVGAVGAVASVAFCTHNFTGAVRVQYGCNTGAQRGCNRCTKALK